MGACNCMGSKKEEGGVIIEERQETAAKSQQEQLPLTKETQEADAKAKLESQVETQVPIIIPLKNDRMPIQILQAQSVFRGYLSRQLFTRESRNNANIAAQLSMNFQELNEVPSHLISPLAKEVFDRSGPFKFEASQTPGVTWRGPTKLSDGSVYVGE